MQYLEEIVNDTYKKFVVFNTAALVSYDEDVNEMAQQLYEQFASIQDLAETVRSKYAELKKEQLQVMIRQSSRSVHGDN